MFNRIAQGESFELLQSLKPQKWTRWGIFKITK